MTVTHFVRHAIVLVTFSGAALTTVACKPQGEDGQTKNFKAEKGMLWWHRKAFLLPILKPIPKAADTGSSAGSSEASGIGVCWYYSEIKDMPKTSADIRKVYLAAQNHSKVPQPIEDLVEALTKETAPAAVHKNWLNWTKKVSVATNGEEVNEANVKKNILEKAGAWALGACMWAFNPILKDSTVGVCSKAINGIPNIVGQLTKGRQTAATPEKAQEIIQGKLASMSVLDGIDTQLEVSWDDIQKLRDIMIPIAERKSDLKGCVEPKNLANDADFDKLFPAPETAAPETETGKPSQRRSGGANWDNPVQHNDPTPATGGTVP